MTGRGSGDDAPSDSGARAQAARAVAVRSEPGLVPGESAMIGAADTAVALKTPAPGEFTEPEPQPPSGVRKLHTEEDLVGTMLLGRYSVTRKIGQGGMGAVYEATHTLIGKRVAVKVLLDKYARKEQVVARLEQEARLASSIGHEHIIDITDFGQTEDGRTFVVMEFLEGESLSELLNREGPLPEQRIVDIARQIASALGAAHAKGIVHRDVKPDNVFLLRRKDKDFVKVVDFGISKSLRASDVGEEDSPRLTQTGMVLGTPLYMSPEQARGDDELDARIDVYALGVIMYELATGRVPFTGTNYLAIISQVLNDDPKSPRAIRPELSEEFEAIVHKALAKERADRYQSTDDILADLNALYDDPTHSTQRARITGPRRPLRQRGGSLRIVVWIAAIAAIVAAVMVAVTMAMGGGPTRKQAAAVVVDAGPPPPPPIDAPAAPPPPAVEIVKLRIETTPSGASLSEGGRDLGVSPREIELPLSNETVSLTASYSDGKDDWEGECKVRPAVDHDQTLRCKLKKLKQGQPRRVKPTGGGSGSAAPTGGGSGSGGGDGRNTAGGELEGNPFTKGP
ncbi:MAG: serine/threonine protein kinase [Myxococcales bacterium]|nr:serine/threonine protein kinase [Myxococcales bacterium]MBK7193005.1 serine/threonine protein kinase [Myxococcales bacterium]MBP6843792.1 serine/threonine protein kinase [Kofleriaceae bacterium]